MAPINSSRDGSGVGQTRMHGVENCDRQMENQPHENGFAPRAGLGKPANPASQPRECGHYLNKHLQGIPGITPVYDDPRGFNSYHLYTLCVEEGALGSSRDAFMRALYYKEGI